MLVEHDVEDLLTKWRLLGGVLEGEVDPLLAVEFVIVEAASV